MDNHTALLDVGQMAEADRLTMASGTSSIALMENAGSAVAREVQQRWSSRPITVLCGPGNNGGDGFVVARQLAAAGWPVRIALLGTRENQPDAAQHHARCWQGSIVPLTLAVLEGAELIIDALFGAGLSRALTGLPADVLSAVQRNKLPMIAIDVPSGVMGDTGEVLGAVTAVLTVTFFRKKPGHVLLPGRLLCGEVILADIGITTDVFKDIVPTTFENAPSLWLAKLPRPLVSDNKYTRGHALLVGGYPMTGASRMAARAAARAGAGLVTIAVPQIALNIYATALISIMVQPFTTPETFAQILSDARLSALLIGPSAGTTDDTRDKVIAMLRMSLPTLLDADALTAFQHNQLALIESITGPCVLTPHDGEFARLFDASGDKLTRSRAAAKRSGAIIVLKGSDTVIASPDGQAIINSNAPPTLATAGAGDVLGGIILGLLAQGMHPFLAAAAGVWLHAAAASEFGHGLMAEDLPDLLPDVFRRLDELDSHEAAAVGH